MQTNEGTYLVQRSINADRASLVKVPHFVNNGSDTNGAQTCRSPSNEFRKGAEELTFSKSGFHTKKVGKDPNNHEQLVSWITDKQTSDRSLRSSCDEFILPFHQRQERGIKGVWHVELVRQLTQEENTFIYELTDDKAHYFAQVSTTNEFLLQSQFN
jgi:hypothetical protein